MLLASPPLDHTNETRREQRNVEHKRPMGREAQREKQKKRCIKIFPQKNTNEQD